MVVDAFMLQTRCIGTVTRMSVANTAAVLGMGADVSIIRQRCMSMVAAMVSVFIAVRRVLARGAFMRQTGFIENDNAAKERRMIK